MLILEKDKMPDTAIAALVYYPKKQIVTAWYVKNYRTHFL